MGKRSNFPKMKNDLYDTPAEAVTPLLPWLPRSTTFIEPCMGRGVLITHLVDAGLVCNGGFEKYYDGCEVYGPGVDATTAVYETAADCFITNPPWTREFLHPIIENLSRQKPTWLLFDADWMHTKQARPYLEYCWVIQSVGRIKWIPDSPFTGKDNCCWYHFDQTNGPLTAGSTEFYGRD